MADIGFDDIIIQKSTDPVRRWRIGNVTVTKVVETEMLRSVEGAFPNSEPGRLEQLRWLHPHFVTPGGALKFSFHSLVIETAARRIVVDTCFGNDKKRPGLFFCDDLQFSFLQDLQSAGYHRDNIDTVLCTHLHSDHVGWNTMMVDGKWEPTFPYAKYLFGRTELDYWMNELKAEDGAALKESMAATYGDSVKPVFEAGLAELVETNHRICDEVRLIPTPGHTVGHVSVCIESQGEAGLITGDTMHHPCQLVHQHWSPGVDHDAELATDTRKAMISELADTATLVIGTHWAGATAGRIVKDGDTYRLAL